MISDITTVVSPLVRAVAKTQRTNKTTKELRAMTNAELQTRFLQVRFYLTRNTLVPSKFRASKETATRTQERQYMSESSRILRIARERGIELRYPTYDEIKARSLFK